MPGLYSVKHLGDVVVVESQNANAKQVFFGWGSGSDPVAVAFYGRALEGAWGPGHELRWRWMLSPAAVSLMIRNLGQQLRPGPFYQADEVRAARELLKKLRRAGGKKRSRKGKKRSRR